MKLLKITSYVLATGFGCGYFPKFPGTIISLLTVLLLWFFPLDTIYIIFISVVLFMIGVPVASFIEKFEGKDSSKIVIDEIPGQLLTFVFIPFTGINIILGFVLFRIFDILKPFPINISQNLPKGWGVMIDDVLAAVYANIALRLIIFSIY